MPQLHGLSLSLRFLLAGGQGVEGGTLLQAPRSLGRRERRSAVLLLTVQPRLDLCDHDDHIVEPLRELERNETGLQPGRETLWEHPDENRLPPATVSSECVEPDGEITHLLEALAEPEKRGRCLIR